MVVYVSWGICARLYLSRWCRDTHLLFSAHSTLLHLRLSSLVRQRQKHRRILHERKKRRKKTTTTGNVYCLGTVFYMKRWQLLADRPCTPSPSSTGIIISIWGVWACREHIKRHHIILSSFEIFFHFSSFFMLLLLLSLVVVAMVLLLLMLLLARGFFLVSLLLFYSFLPFFCWTF